MRISDRIYAMWLWHYWYRRCLGWLPVQFCLVCGKPYWGGWPRFSLERKWNYTPIFTKKPWIGRKSFEAWAFTNTWQAGWQDYCSKKCSNDDWEEA